MARLYSLTWSPASTPAAPSTGAHVLVKQSVSQGNASVTSSAITTQASGSSLIVLAAQGNGSNLGTSSLSDSKGNTYALQGSKLNYANFPSSSAALFKKLNAAGGSGHTFTFSGLFQDEGTLAAVEVIGGHTVQDFASASVASGTALVSPTVTTTGPATIVAFISGGGGFGISSYGGVSNGFTMLDSYGATDGVSVQVASATRDVSAAGTYGLTWTIAPAQDALLFIIAIGA